MTPWWLRPTAEGVNEAETRKERPAAPPPAEELPEAQPSLPEPASLATVPPLARPYLPTPEPPAPEPEPPLLPFEEDEDEAPAAGGFEIAAATVETIDAADEGADEALDEGAEGAEGKGEPKKRRSRRSRGGRRKNGRATVSADAAEDDDEDDMIPFGDEPAAAPAPVAPPAAPAPAARERWAKPAPEPTAPSPLRSRGSDSFVIPAAEFGDTLTREIVISVPERSRGSHDERKIAMFCDLENIALGVRDSEISKFDIGLILERLLEKGKIIVKKAYADWERYSEYKRPFHEAAIELIDIPQKYYSGKNSADIKMVVDAMDLSYAKEHLDTFVLLSGDSDFSPLVSKLKENNKYVIGIGVKNSSSSLLIDNCDEFIYYEDVWRDSQQGPKLDGLNKKTAEAFALMVESIHALARENKDVLWGSMIKQTMQRKKPSFNEGYYGYSTFSELLEDAERKNIVKLKKDQRSGTYIVTGFAKANESREGGGRGRG